MAEAELIVSGPHKRKETSRVTDNADPLLKSKKARLAPKAAKPSTKKGNLKTPHHHPSMEIQEVNDDTDTIQHAFPKNPNHIIKAADGSDDEENLRDSNNNPAPDLMDVEDEDEEDLEENAEDELCELIATMN
jgi:hypothetical protein